MNGVTTASLSPVLAQWIWIVCADANMEWRDGKTPCTFTAFLRCFKKKSCRV